MNLLGHSQVIFELTAIGWAGGLIFGVGGLVAAFVSVRWGRRLGWVSLALGLAAIVRVLTAPQDLVLTVGAFFELAIFWGPPLALGAAALGIAKWRAGRTG